MSHKRTVRNNKYLRTSWDRPYDLASVVVPTFDDVEGELILGPAPGKKDDKWNRDMDYDIEVLKELEVDVVICMLEWSELSNLDMIDYPTIIQQEGILFYHIQTEDHTAPELGSIIVIVPLVARYLLDGYNVLVHCRGGMGRAATICACVLIYLNHIYEEYEYTAQDAIKDIRYVRPKALKNKSQVQIIEEYTDYIEDN